MKTIQQWFDDIQDLKIRNFMSSRLMNHNHIKKEEVDSLARAIYEGLGYAIEGTSFWKQVHKELVESEESETLKQFVYENN